MLRSKQTKAIRRASSILRSGHPGPGESAAAAAAAAGLIFGLLSPLLLFLPPPRTADLIVNALGVDCSPQRGSVPVAWSIDPLLAERFPSVSQQRHARFPQACASALNTNTTAKQWGRYLVS